MTIQVRERCNQLNNLGLRDNGKCYSGIKHNNKDFTIEYSELYTETEKEWSKTIKEFKNQLEKRNQAFLIL